MFKPCPDCGFLVALIAGREASQRCPRCGGVLVTAEQLAEDAATPVVDEGPRPLRTRPQHPGDAGPAPHAVAAAQLEPADLHDTARAALATEGQFPDDARPMSAARGATPVDPAPQPPGFTRGRASATAQRGRRWPLLLVLPLLAMLLALQLLLAQRDELAADARWRPLVGGACGVLGCQLPPWREPAALAMLARDVRPHPTRAGVLHASATLRNDARWPQALPVVVLSLSDIEGRIVGTRAIAAAGYAQQPDALLAPGETIDIAFDLREPSPRVVSFDFQLR